MKIPSTRLLAVLALAGCAKSADPAPKPSLVGTWQLVSSRMVVVPYPTPYDKTEQYAPGSASLSFTAAGTATSTLQNQSPNQYTYTFDGTTLVLTNGSGSFPQQVVELTEHRLQKVLITPFGSSTATLTATYTR
jgi:hypothetical protein